MSKTEHILSLSYGKDSLACLEAITILGLPLDRIVHAEVWATDTIPADLPPMVEFKAKADRIIEERYGLKVEHISALSRERERENSDGRMKTSSILLSMKENVQESYTDFLSDKEHGATADSKYTLNTGTIKTYESLFYRKMAKGSIRGFANKWALYCSSDLKRACFQTSPLRKGLIQILCDILE